MSLTSAQIQKIRYHSQELLKLIEEAEKADAEASKQRKIKVSRRSATNEKYSLMYKKQLNK